MFLRMLGNVSNIPDTEWLQLVPFTTQLLELAAADDRRGFARVAGVRIPESWPSHGVRLHQLPLQLAALREDPEGLPWHGRLIVVADHGSRSLAGVINLKGPPDDLGCVEIGYEVLPEYRRRGVASAAARALLEWCFETAHVKAVRARTLKGNTVSQHMLKRLGFARIGPERDPELGEMVAWEFRPTTSSPSAKS
ncbi:MAG: GNAT family N-acetyltransferase [Planctomycetes bacterium]|nr:GNAT family N-acetyltransferase [Planctomycetota bacterium]